MFTEWKLSPFDVFCLGMTIKGAWIYRSAPDPSRLEESLGGILRRYPLLTGRYDAARKAVVWDRTPDTEGFLSEVDAPGHKCSEDMYKLVPQYNTDDFKKGKCPAFHAWYIRLDDGVAVVAQGAHAVMDGCTFYNLIKEWALLTCSGKTSRSMTVDQGLLPGTTAFSREETVQKVTEAQWVKLGMKDLLRMVLNGIRYGSKDRFSIEVSQEQLGRLREETGAGTNAVLCALAVDMLHKASEKAGKRKCGDYTLLEVADLRGRACGIGEDFFGNFSQAVVMGRFSPGTPARAIREAAGKALAPERLDMTVRLSFCVNGYALPYFFFNASSMNTPSLDLIYINNQLRLKAWDTDFGCGLPLRVQQAELEDMVKFWQSSQDGPVEIIFTGAAAKLLKKYHG